MKLSTAIFLGCEKSRPAVGNFIKPRGRGKFPEACALGAAAIGEYGIQKAIDGFRGKSSTFLVETPWWPKLKNEAEAVGKMVKSLRGQGYKFNKLGPPTTLQDIIINLNDAKKWKRENIARFIQGYGF